VDGENRRPHQIAEPPRHYFQKELKRFYPKRALAAQVLGYVGMEDTGLAGIEHLYQEQLNGVKGRVVTRMDARASVRTHGASAGAGRKCSAYIDEKIQYIAEKELAQAMQETQASAGRCGADPRTANYCTGERPFVQSEYLAQITPEKLKNHAVSDVYEPGSVFKTVTYSSGV